MPAHFSLFNFISFSEVDGNRMENSHGLKKSVQELLFETIKRLDKLTKEVKHDEQEVDRKVKDNKVRILKLETSVDEIPKQLENITTKVDVVTSLLTDSEYKLRIIHF